MKIEDLKPNARLVLKGPLKLTGFKVGEVSVVDGVGAENVVFKGALVVKRDVVLERFMTEPEWKEYRESLPKPDLHKTVADLSAKVDAMTERFNAFIDALSTAEPVTLAPTTQSDTTAEQPKRKVKVLHVNSGTLEGIEVFRIAEKDLTREEFTELHDRHSPYQFDALKRMKKIIKPVNGSDSYRLTSYADKIRETGEYEVCAGKIVRVGDYSGPAPSLKVYPYVKSKSMPPELTAAHVNMSSNGRAH